VAARFTGVLLFVLVQVGGQTGCRHAWDVLERPWTTSFVRVPSTEPRWLYTTHLDGNAQADTNNHGRPDQAVLLYAAAHYPLWRAELGRPEIGPGGFGDNITVEDS
jgi:MOSC domain-containing protein YiiM